MKFIKGKELNDCIINLFSEADENLMILLPLDSLSEEFKLQILEANLNKRNTHITLGFGFENEHTVSDKLSFLNFFYQFQNITIIYLPDLSDEFYNNQNTSIISSKDSVNYSTSSKEKQGLCLNKNNFEYRDLYFSTLKKHKEYLEEKGLEVYVKKPKIKINFWFLNSNRNSD